jgi:regulator of cell morphogenesis and NO signaling
MSTTTVHQYFTADHRRLDDLMRTFQSEKRRDFSKAKDAFREFLFGLRRHIVWEEDILFSSFEKRSGIGSGGPTAVMRAEHRLINDALDELHEKVRRADPECDAEVRKLTELLSVHNLKEENILYPMFDEAVDAEERGRLFKQMEEIPRERYVRCCV